jgi:NTP pyrophosphatase (non-canonical NTP hydrolase)
MSDHTTTVDQLRAIVRSFVDERDWNQFHSPKNLSMSLAIEAAELMEHFQWLTIDESRQVRQNADELAAAGDELADVLCYVLALANELDLDLSDCLGRKMIKNAEKYPVEQIRGRFGHDDRGRHAPT